jgi:catechol 2,3-dioxygenase-like lactoylglutathione lyase family enzyme
VAKGRIQSITVAAYEQEKLADFYCEVFGMRAVRQISTDSDAAPRGILLTDGHTTFGIHKAGLINGKFRPEGLHDFGFLVDDLEEVGELAAENGGLWKMKLKDRSDAADKHAQAGLFDPIGVSIDLTERGYPVVPPGASADSSDPWAPPADIKPRIQHLTVAAFDQEKVAEFYGKVFGMDVVYRRGFGETGDENLHDGGIYMSDGHINFVIHKACVVRGAFRPEKLNHFGFVVDDMDPIFERAEKAGALKTYRKSAPYSDGALMDPIGNNIDVSVRGYGLEVPEDVYVNPLAKKR